MKDGYIRRASGRSKLKFCEFILIKLGGMLANCHSTHTHALKSTNWLHGTDGEERQHGKKLEKNGIWLDYEGSLARGWVAKREVGNLGGHHQPPAPHQ